MNSKTKVVFVGGTRRAVNLFSSISVRPDIEIVKAIFMKGYEDEHHYCDQLVKMATEKNINHLVSDTIDENIIASTKELSADVILGGGIWRTYIPGDFFNAARLGYIGLHGSGLPAYRGWAGINWYMINGEPQYIMRMLQLNTDYDAGPLVADDTGNPIECSIDLKNEKHVGEILEEIYPLHIEINNRLLDLVVQNKIQFITQNSAEATYTCQRGPSDGEINWDQPTEVVFNFIRAQSKPYPGAFTWFNGKKVILWRVKPLISFSNYIGRIPGKVVTRDKESDRVVILTSDGGIEVQAAECPSLDSNSPFSIFNSVRKRCTNRVEAYLDSIGWDG